MKRLRHWLFNSVAALSLLLWTATAALGISSHFKSMHWRFIKPDYAFYYLQVYSGKFSYVKDRLVGIHEFGAIDFIHFGFFFHHRPSGAMTLEIPAYAAAILFAILPVFWLTLS